MSSQRAQRHTEQHAQALISRARSIANEEPTTAKSLFIQAADAYERLAVSSRSEDTAATFRRRSEELRSSAQSQTNRQHG
jgi:hypothetical protein